MWFMIISTYTSFFGTLRMGLMHINWHILYDLGGVLQKIDWCTFAFMRFDLCLAITLETFIFIMYACKWFWKHRVKFDAHLAHPLRTWGVLKVVYWWSFAIVRFDLHPQISKPKIQILNPKNQNLNLKSRP
jgi:hypothetical protein